MMYCVWFFLGGFAGFVLGMWYQMRQQTDYLKLLKCHLNGLREALLNAQINDKEPKA